MQNLNDLLSKTPKIAKEEEKEKLKEKLTEMKIEQAEKEASIKASQSGFSYINLKNFPISPEALRLIKQEDAWQQKVICFYATEREAKIASLHPEKLEKFRETFSDLNNLKTEIYLISENSFNLAYKLYATLPKIYKPLKGVSITGKDLEQFQKNIKTFKDLDNEIKRVNVTNLVTLVISSAIISRASDIHIEAEEKGIKIRFRIDGVLVDVADIDKKFWQKIVARIKILSGLKINITNKPQDGRFTIGLAKGKIDVRVSCLPTDFGESVVMRLLRSTSAGLEFKDLGIFSYSFDKLKRQIERPNGMILTTGPTGSGKTTTLYSILKKLNNPQTKIITLENPVEYELEGINQSQMDPSKGYTFAKGLRSILRQDPDVIMVGEIRDLETAQTAIQAALTGHLVISTLHTNDAAGAIPRLLSMGVKPFLITPAINAIIGQRLVRKICPHCKEEIKLKPKILERVKKILSDIPESAGVKIDFNNLKFYHGKGCPFCQGLGYYGRIGIYEVFTITKEVEKAIASGDVSEYKMKELAKKQGMVTMIQDGLIKASQGITTVDEVFRVSQ